MKKVIILFCMICLTQNNFAQAKIGNYTVLNKNVSIAEKNVNTATIPWNSTTHFVSPEPILYVDISSPNIQGDLPEKNIFRLRPDLDKVHPGDKFTITIVTLAYISVYKLTVADPLSNDSARSNGAYVISVNPNDAVQVNQSDVLNNQQCFDLAIKSIEKKRNILDISTRAYGMKMYVANIYSIGDYILLRLNHHCLFRYFYKVYQKPESLNEITRIRGIYEQDRQQSTSNRARLIRLV